MASCGYKPTLTPPVAFLSVFCFLLFMTLWCYAKVCKQPAHLFDNNGLQIAFTPPGFAKDVSSPTHLCIFSHPPAHPENPTARDPTRPRTRQHRLRTDPAPRSRTLCKRETEHGDHHQLKGDTQTQSPTRTPTTDDPQSPPREQILHTRRARQTSSNSSLQSVWNGQFL